MTRKAFLNKVENQFPNGLMKCFTEYEEIGNVKWESNYAIVCTFSQDHKVDGYLMVYNFHTMKNEIDHSIKYETYEAAAKYILNGKQQ